MRTGVVFAQGDSLADQGRLRVAVVRGNDLLVAQDNGDAAKIFRVPLGPPIPGGSDAATPLPAPTDPSGAATPAATSPIDRVRALSHSLAQALQRAWPSGTCSRAGQASVPVDSPGAGVLVVSTCGSAQRADPGSGGCGCRSSRRPTPTSHD